MRLYHPVSLLALLAASPVLAQDTRPSATTDSHQGPDIVVQGARPTAPLEGGEWTLTLSRAHHFGDDITGSASGTSGKDRIYRFCLHDTDVAALVRVLVGQGQTKVAGTTSCGRMKIQLADEKLRGTQICEGGSVPEDPVAPLELGTKNASIPDKPRMVPSKITLTVTGEYTTERLALRFESKLEKVPPPLLLEEFGKQTPPSRPDLTDWTITAVRDGSCPATSTNGAP